MSTNIGRGADQGSKPGGLFSAKMIHSSHPRFYNSVCPHNLYLFMCTAFDITHATVHRLVWKPHGISEPPSKQLTLESQVP